MGPPVVNISGASLVTKGRREIILNASQSYDQHANCGDSLYFTWFCRRCNETYPENNPVLVIDFPNGNASGGCYGYGPGRFSVQDNVLVLDVDKMEASQTYAIELLVSNGVKSSEAVHWLTVLEKLFSIRWEGIHITRCRHAFCRVKCHILTLSRPGKVVPAQTLNAYKVFKDRLFGKELDVATATVV